MSGFEPIERVIPKPGQESVWDYPRPPICEATAKRIVVVFGGQVLCETTSAYRVLETSHPPVYYLPRQDCNESMLRPAAGTSFCEWKGGAQYFDVVAKDVVAKDLAANDVVASNAGAKEHVAAKAAWTYPTPTPRFAAIAHFVAVYPSVMDRCTVDGVDVEPQPGGFYGGWVTPDVVGPFKGGPGTMGW